MQWLFSLICLLFSLSIASSQQLTNMLWGFHIKPSPYFLHYQPIQRQTFTTAFCICRFLSHSFLPSISPPTSVCTWPLKLHWNCSFQVAQIDGPFSVRIFLIWLPNPIHALTLSWTFSWYLWPLHFLGLLCLSAALWVDSWTGSFSFLCSFQIALIWGCPHLYLCPKPLHICLLDNSTGTSHRHFPCKTSESLTPHPLVDYVPFISKSCMDVLFFLSWLGPSQFKLLPSLIWIINHVRDLPDSAFAPVWSSLHTTDEVIFWRQAG